MTGLEQTERLRSSDRLRLRSGIKLAVQLTRVTLDGIQRDVQLCADLASGQTSGEPSQHGELGRTRLFDKCAAAGVRSSRDEAALDRRGDRREPPGSGNRRDRPLRTPEVGRGARQPRWRHLWEYEQGVRSDGRRSSAKGMAVGARPSPTVG